MLVLSRRPRERVVFPTLDVNVEVIRIGGNSVRLGIRAPKGVRVLREELVDQLQQAVQEKSADRSDGLRHELRNHLQSIGLAADLAEQHLRQGDMTQAETMIQRVLTHLADAEKLLAGATAGQESLSMPAPTANDDPAPKSTKRRSALLVEDNENESELLSQLLRMHGYTVTTVNNGRAAIERLSDGLRPDVVLLDMRMPELDGPATITELRRDPQLRSLPVIGVSGSDPMQTGVNVGPDGVNAWFRKPVDSRSLVQAIHETLDDESGKPAYLSGA